MKKSTLITTIAMIVVVVIALSTATYAWFSASSTNKVTATVSTSGNGDFALSQATVADPAAATGIAGLSNWSAATDAINLNADPLMSGLHAPTAEITLATCGITDESATKGMAKFYQAESSDNNTTAKLTADAGYLKPVVLRIQNISGSPKQLKVYVDINIGDGTNSATNAAGRSVAFAMICQDSTFESGSVLTSGYGYAGTAASGYVNNATVTSPSTAPTTTGYTRRAYNGTTTDFYKLLAADPESGDSTATAGRGGAANDYVDSQSLTIDANLPNAGIVYVTLYLWIDGWRANNSAAGANQLKIGFRFYGEAVS